MKDSGRTSAHQQATALSPSHIKARKWYVAAVTVERQALEAVEYGLMEAGALGVEVQDQAESFSVVIAYFDAPCTHEQVQSALGYALHLYDLPHTFARNIELREIADEDWLGEWKKSWQPVAVGKRFVIAPPWSEVAAAPDRIVIRIEPGMAFGTGTHETTRLCLAAIEKYFQGASFLDVGTGTGILAIAAARLNPSARIEACDVDADAVAIARENARLNNLGDARINFRVGTVGEETLSADCVCANLTADVIVPLLPALTNATCGRLILSGILDTQTELVLDSLSRLGVTIECEVLTNGEWIAVIV